MIQFAMSDQMLPLLQIVSKADKMALNERNKHESLVTFLQAVKNFSKQKYQYRCFSEIHLNNVSECYCQGATFL